MSDALTPVLDWLRSRVFGKHRGLVVDNEDPQKRGRVKVLVPAVLGAAEVWALPCVPYAGEKVGFHFLPDKDAAVWVEFEGGDPQFPIWVGCFWGQGQLPQGATAPTIRTLETTKAVVRIDDEKDVIHLETSAGVTLELAEDGVLETGESRLTVDGSGVHGDAATSSLKLTSSGLNVNNGALEVT